MTREEYIQAKIKELGFTNKSFSSHIGMPYTTLLSILNGSIGGTAVDNAIKICDGLGITINDLQSASSAQKRIVLSEHEKQLISAYRSHPEMQPAVDTLLGIEQEVKKENLA